VADKGYSSTDPHLPAAAGHQSGDPGTDRPGQQPDPTGESRCRLDKAAYRRRNLIERCFNRRKHNKALATRYDKRARHYQALVTIACLRW
jgi:transposase